VKQNPWRASASPSPRRRRLAIFASLGCLLVSVAAPVTSAATVVGNLVWLDSNGNGIQDGGESPVANVTVRIYDLGADGPWTEATTC